MWKHRGFLCSPWPHTSAGQVNSVFLKVLKNAWICTAQFTALIPFTALCRVHFHEQQAQKQTILYCLLNTHCEPENKTSGFKSRHSDQKTASFFVNLLFFIFSQQISGCRKILFLDSFSVLCYPFIRFWIWSHWKRTFNSLNDNEQHIFIL